MSFIFLKSLNENNNENINEGISFETTREIPFSSYLYGDEAISLESEYNEILLNSFRATYNALKENYPVINIIYEGFYDTAQSIVNWFKSWLTRFLKFVSDAFEKLFKWTTECNREVQMFYNDKTFEFEPFIVTGYKYTFNIRNINTNIITDVFEKTEKYINKVLTNKGNDLRSVVSLACNDIGGDNVLADYRGDIVGINDSITEGAYGLELFKAFRNGADEPEDVLVNKSIIKEMKKLIEKLQFAVNKLKDDRDRLQKQTESIIAFISAQPRKVGKEDELRLDSDIKYATLHSNATVSKREEYTDREIYQALTVIYTCANSTIQRIHMMYDKYFIAKMTALNEAIHFYHKCIRMTKAQIKGSGE